MYWNEVILVEKQNFFLWEGLEIIHLCAKYKMYFQEFHAKNILYYLRDQTVSGTDMEGVGLDPLEHKGSHRVPLEFYS